jgi:hypothetical protein
VPEGVAESSDAAKAGLVDASLLRDEEREVAKLLPDAGFEYESHNNEYLVFREAQKKRGRSASSLRSWLPRSFAEELRSQLREKAESHPRSTGLVIPAEGYVELVSSRFTPIAAKRLFQLESSNITCVHREPARALPSLPYQWPDEEHESVKRVHLSGVGLEPCLEISNASPLAMVRYGGAPDSGRVRLASRPIPFLTTLKVAYPAAMDRELLERVSEEAARSLLYELDVRNGVVMELDAPSAGLEAPFVRRLSEVNRMIRYPRAAVKYEVSVLFGFASQATKDPPQAFLAYYQALEYFIPTAIRQNAIKSVRRELRDPAFDLNDDASLLRVIKEAESPSSAAEPNQLRILVNEYVRTSRLEDFFKHDWGDYFSSKGPIKGVASINERNLNLSLPHQVADRVYQIRNRLVHAKNDPKFGDARVLLPRSTASNALAPDVLLVRLLATEAIAVGLSG